MTTWAAIHDQRRQQLKANARSSTKIFFLQKSETESLYVCSQQIHHVMD